MRIQLMTTVLAVSLALGSAVFAAATVDTGTIKTIDAKAMTVTLSDGTVFYFSAGVKLDGFKVGEKVMIDYTLAGNKHDATSITAN